MGVRSPLLVALLRRAHHARTTGRAAGDTAQAAQAGDTRRRGRAGAPRAPLYAAVSTLGERIAAATSSLRLPSTRVSALLVLAFLSFGVILGDETGSPASYTLAASARPHLKFILAPTRTASSSSASPSSASSSSSGAASSGVEPPGASPEPTPAASPAKSTKGSKPASSGKGSAPSSSSGSGSGSTGPSSSGSHSKLPPVRHVFVIMLSDQPYAASFGPSSSSPYLSQTLERRGELLVRYYAVAHQELANEIALLSGQGPTTETAADCPAYADVAPATVGPEGQVDGQGCVYPSTTETLAGQLTAKQLTWRSYVEGMDETAGNAPACAHPPVGQPDPTVAPTPFGPAYATFHDPFVYFHAVIDSSACAADVVGLSRLSSDLAHPKRTPSFSYIVPDSCHDGRPTPCAAGAPSGMPAANGFLARVVGKILASAAYKDGGLLVITVDQAPSSGVFADSSSCCGEPHFPNLPAPATPASGLAAKGGGQVGALLLSPFIKPGTTSQEPYNHFSLLRTIEDLFALKHLGYAAGSHVSSFEASVFSAYKPG
jgi:hypothetical protein